MIFPKRILVLLSGLMTAAICLLLGAPARREGQQIARLRNLGKALYENPTTYAQAVETFKKALDLAPNSARERVNYGLALLRLGKEQQGIEELMKAQRQDPLIPHTWFNLGITFKKDGQYDAALVQFEQMVRLVPNEPISHYNLGYLFKVTGRPDLAEPQFEMAERLAPSLAGPHFQLYNAYRMRGRDQDAAREWRLFQEIKKQQEGSAIPEDLDWSPYAEIYEVGEPCPGESIDHPPPLQFQDSVVANEFDPATAGLAVLDADGDGRPDLVAWSKKGVRLFKSGSDPVRNSGLDGLTGVVSISPGDFNNDGRPDLCVVTESGVWLYMNRGNTFESPAVPLTTGKYSRAVWMDYDHDYDLDLILLGEKSALFRNNGDRGFSDESARFPFLPGHALDGVAFDAVANGTGVDLAVAYADRAGVLYRDQLGGRYQPEILDALPAGTKFLAALDFNSDGWTDLAGATSLGVALLVNHEGKLAGKETLPGAGGPVTFGDFDNYGMADLVSAGTIYRNHGGGRLTSSIAECHGAVAVAVADFSGRQSTDLAAISGDGTLHLLRSTPPAANSWLRVGLTGIRNRKLAEGAIVEVKAGCRYSKAVYQGTPLLFGLGSYKTADTVRITWPNGLVQNEIDQAVNRTSTFKEAQRLSGSCPMVFAWNGKRFEFITDVLGVAPLGASSGDGQYFPVDHQEYIQIPGESLAPVDDRYEVRITEELREVSYLDAVHLISVDHPQEWEIFTNEKFKAPPFPVFRLFGARRRVYPRSARDSVGHDVRDRLLRQDHTYPDAFQRNYCGEAAMHTLDLDFGNAAADNRALLILNGWVDWADGSTFLAAAQDRKGGLIFPYLQVRDQRGHWKTVIQDMGMPAGKPKTIAVDLTGKFLSASREIRIVTNLCIYWDEIFLSEQSSPPPVVLTPVQAETADLHFRGFSTPTIDSARRQPEAFDYARWIPETNWNPTAGFYTRYGDVGELLINADDRLVLMGAGDELRLLFRAGGLPPLRQGWKRDFLLLVDGWAKDQDPNTAFSQTVEPLPFHGMSAYPYPQSEHFPDDSAHRAYRKKYNTRPALKFEQALAGLSVEPKRLQSSR
jgi:tetratricopeptide (TPR) repeat protein